MKAVEAHPLYWPEDRKRAESRISSPFRGSFDAVRRNLCDELDRMGAINAIISTNVPLRADGMPRAGVHRVSDPGVAVYFEYSGKPMCFACDKFTLVWENIRAIAKTVEAIRGIERWGSSDMMERAFRGFTAIPERAGEYWRDVFGFDPDQKVTDADIETAFRRLALTKHPDKGGTLEEWNLLCNSRGNARKDIGAAR